jgi:hypothetical protein
MKIKIKAAVCTAFCFIFSFCALAQGISQPANSIPNAAGDFYSHLNQKAWELNAVKAKELESMKPKVIGNSFLRDDWSTGTLYVTLNRKVESQPLKYDIENNLFLVKEGEDRKYVKNDTFTVVNGVIVLAFEVQDPEKGTRRYLNSTNSGFKRSGEPALGFLEILVDGDINLYMKTELSILKANFNMALNIGEKEDRVVKENVYYLRKKEQDELFQISKNKKDNLTFFQEKQAEVNSYIKQQNLKFNREEDLIQLVKHYNSLN